MALRTASSLVLQYVMGKSAQISMVHQTRFLTVIIDQEMSAADIFEVVAVQQRRITH